MIEKMPSQHVLNRCADAWKLRNIQFVRKMENIVFSCDNDVGKVFLRLTTPLRRSRSEIEAEVHWLLHLSKCGIKVPDLIPDRNGNQIVSLTDGDQQFEAVVFAEVKGKHPEKELAADPEFLKKLGMLIAQMHAASQNYQRSHLGKREEWFEERGIRHALQAAKVSKEENLREQLEEVMAWMQQLPRTPKTYGLIHADLGILNLFYDENDSIGIIDFDDSCYHWFVFDLVIVIFSLAGKFEHAKPEPIETKWLNDLLEGYRRVLPLSKEEAEWIPNLLKFALLRLFFWIESHQTLQTFHEDAVERVEGLKQWVKTRFQAAQRL